MCILSLCALLKVVGYYDLSFLSMSVMGFSKNKKFVIVRSIHFVWIF